MCIFERCFIIRLPLTKNRMPKDANGRGWFIPLNVEAEKERKRIYQLNVFFGTAEKCLCEKCNPNSSTFDDDGNTRTEGEEKEILE